MARSRWAREGAQAVPHYLAQRGENMADIEKLSRIDITILKRKRSALNQSWHGERVNDPFSRLYYIRKGCGFIESNGERHPLRAGCLYVIPPRGDFTYGCSGELEIWWVHFTATLLAGISLFDYLSYETERVPADPSTAEMQMAQLIDCAEGDNICTVIRCNGVLLELLSGFLHPESCSVKTEYHKKVERFLPVLEHIARNLSGKITIDRLARISSYERSHFTVLFKNLFGISPVSYINQQRVDAVLLMLQSGNKKLEDLAAEYGFYDAYHLSKVVKRYTGKSPREHLKQMHESRP